MRISSIYNGNNPVLSLEIFPPKPDHPIETIYSTIDSLAHLNPGFISVTYGAGGSSKGRTVEIASRIKNDYNIESIAHLTCVSHKKKDIESVLQSLKDNNIENILALRGDPPHGVQDYDYFEEEFHYASDLIEYINKKNDYCILAAAYPEGHIDSDRMSDDWDNLINKINKGAEVLITQLFFDNRVYYNFMEYMDKKNVKVPIIPGIMPIVNIAQIKRIIKLCGASMPAKLLVIVDKYGDNKEDMSKAGIEYTINQIEDLLINNVKGIHLEPLNRPKVAKEIVDSVKSYF